MADRAIAQGCRGSTVVVIAVVAALLLGLGDAARAGEGEIVAFRASAGGVVWQPLVPFDHGVLTVSGPGGVVLHEEFGPGAGLALDPFARLGGHPPDGTYVWEVRLGRPSAVPPQLRARAQAAHEAGGDPAAEAALRLAFRRATRVQSGAFRILDGALVPSDRVEPRARPQGSRSHDRPRSPFAAAALAVDPDDVPILPVDQVFGENLIVDGWACIGTDCVDGELFGLEALKLKDTLLGIRFEDTSGPGFPARDWQLTANDPGAVEKFAIEDLTAATIPFTVFGAAPSNALVVDGFGNVGVGTATPGTDLHLRGGGAPRLRIEQDTSAGFLPQTWDLTADLVNLAFVVEDVTNNRKPFSIQATTGRVGIGTLNPQGNLHIAGGAGQDVFSGIGPNLVSGPALNFGYAGASFGRGAGFFNVRPDVAAFPPNPSLRFATDNVQRMIITNTGNVGIGTLAPTNPLQMASGARVTAGGVWTDASSRESKQEIAPLSADAARAALGQLAPVTFAYRADPAERHVGFVAEDVPALVATADRKGLSPMDIVAVLTRVVQEQQRMVQEQQRLVQEQQAAMARLEAEVAELRRAAGR